MIVPVAAPPPDTVPALVAVTAERPPAWTAGPSPGSGGRRVRIPAELLVPSSRAVPPAPVPRRSLARTADPLRPRQTYLRQIGWTRPREVIRPVVAVLDTGVDARHPDLRGVLDTVRARSFAGGSPLRDPSGHGTHVAGIIGAVSGNTVGGSGVSTARILPIRITDASGVASTSSLVRGIRYAIACRVAVINISLGGRGYSEQEQLAVQDAVRAGIVVVAAAGNGGQSGDEPEYPGAYPHVIAVSAVNPRGVPLAQSTGGPQVTIAAPGWRILSTAPGGRYGTRSGTSMAAAVVSGVAARIRANRPVLSPSQVSSLLASTAAVTRDRWRDPRLGAGVVSVRGALSAPSPPRDRPEPDDDPWTVRSAPEFLPDAIRTASATATLQPSTDDSDAYRVYLRAGSPVTIEVEGAAPGMDPDIWIWRPGAPRRLDTVRPSDLRDWRLTASVGAGTTERLEGTAPVSGVYTVEVRVNAVGGPYRITATRGAE